jgi:putative phosphoesterase
LVTRVGLVADTHLASDEEDLPRGLLELLTDVDLVLHAGDIYLPRALEQLADVAPVVAVEGNGDRHFRKFPESRNPAHGRYRLEKYQWLEVEDLKIGLAHIFPLPVDEPYIDLRALADHCFSAWPDVIVAGDTHVPAFYELPDVTIVNPGSPTLPGQVRGLGTAAVLMVDGASFEFELLHLTGAAPQRMTRGAARQEGLRWNSPA